MLAFVLSFAVYIDLSSPITLSEIGFHLLSLSRLISCYESFR